MTYKRKKIRAGEWLYRGVVLEKVGGFDGDEPYWIAEIGTPQDTLYAMQGEVDYVLDREGA